MIQQGLSPGVQNGQETDFSSKMSWVGSDGTNCLCRRPEENGINDSFILQRDGSNFLRDGKNDVIIRNRKQFIHTCLEPLGFGKTLAFGTVAVPAGVVGMPLLTAPIAHVDVAAQKGGSANLNGAHGTTLLP